MESPCNRLVSWAGQMSRRPRIAIGAATAADPLPTGAEALGTSPSPRSRREFLRIDVRRAAGKVQHGQTEVHCARSPIMPIRAILAKMRHDGCGGRGGKAELLTGIEGVGGWAVRRIVLREELNCAREPPETRRSHRGRSLAAWKRRPGARAR